MKRSLRILFMTTALVGAVSLPALAQDKELQNMVDRMERMDRDIKALSLKVFRNVGSSEASSAVGPDGSAVDDGSVAPTLGARFSVRLNELENQMRQMTGQIEETAYRISQLNTRLDKLVADVDYRLTALEGGTPVARPQGGENTVPSKDDVVKNGLTGSTLPPPAPSGQPGVLGTLNASDLQDGTEVAAVEPATPTPTLTPDALYEQSRQLLLRGQPLQAEAGFKTFLENNKDHALTGNVRYWLGEAYYVQGQFNEAASTFLEGYQKDSRGAKAPDSLLKLGMSLTRLEKLREACATFSKLRADFPKMPAHISKTLERERTTAKCS